MEEERGTLKAGEQHPASSNAIMYLNSLGLEKLLSYAEAFASCAIEGNRMAEIRHETLRKILSKYLSAIGICWVWLGLLETWKNGKRMKNRNAILWTWYVSGIVVEKWENK